jgi:hypothetical protein
MLCTPVKRRRGAFLFTIMVRWRPKMLSPRAAAGAWSRIHFGQLMYRFDLNQPPAEPEPRIISKKSV